MDLQEKIQSLECLVMLHLETATNLKLGLSDDEDQYHLAYVAKKITECAVAMEKLSDMQMQLTRISLEVTKMAQDARFLLKKEQASLQAQPQYQELPGASRANWLQQKSAAREKEVESLNYLSRVVAEVRGAISDKLGTMKRLDSDIRGHQKLIEAGGLGSNATAPKIFPSSGDKNLDI